MKCEANIHPILNTLEGPDAAILFSGQWGNDKPKRTWISQFLHIKSFIIQIPPHPQQHMQWLSPALEKCKSNTCLEKNKESVWAGRKQWRWFIKKQNDISQVCFLLEVHYNLNQNWTAVLVTMALCHSRPTIKISSVSKSYCPLAAQPSWTQPLPEPDQCAQHRSTLFLPRLGNRCLQTPCLVCHSLPCFCLLFSNTRRQHLML